MLLVSLNSSHDLVARFRHVLSAVLMLLQSKLRESPRSFKATTWTSTNVCQQCEMLRFDSTWWTKCYILAGHSGGPEFSSMVTLKAYASISDSVDDTNHFELSYITIGHTIGVNVASLLGKENDHFQSMSYAQRSWTWKVFWCTPTSVEHTILLYASSASIWAIARLASFMLYVYPSRTLAGAKWPFWTQF